MEERYEIRGKIGQGGLGSVYRAFDRHLQREVAIKRILTAKDGADSEEAARQMTQETGALAALQHPNIVTIYDVGIDDDGPFVVMELLKGETLDEIVERAPLTESDFLEFARQVQEGLIAAQDLGIVHRDLKPSNVMVNWLPSGKFQVKLVDFGLAKFSPQPSRQTVDHNDSVYGSIFFMAPEQFERALLDARTDMYAIGCVYYFALAARSPFEGETGPQVMAAHLQHRVVPLAQIRPDLSQWILDWIMWHINRDPLDRPENAREALSSFMDLETANRALSSATGPVPPLPPVTQRPRLIIPGAQLPEESPLEPTPEAPSTKTMPQPMQPPSDAPPSLHTASQPVSPTQPVPAPDAPPPAPVTQMGKPRLHVPGQPEEPAELAPPAPGPLPSAKLSTPQPSAAPLPASPPRKASKKKKGMSPAAKGVLILTLVISVGIAGAVLIQKLKENDRNDRYNALVAKAADTDVHSLPVNREQLDLLLDSTRLGTNRTRPTLYRALAIAEPKDGTDVSAYIAEFATTQPLTPEIRSDLLGQVLVARKSPSVVPFLIDYLKTSQDPATATAALKAIGGVATTDQLRPVLDFLTHAEVESLRRAAENAAAAIIDRAKDKLTQAVVIDEVLQKTDSTDARRALIRLFGHAGGKRAEAAILQILDGDDKLDQLAAIEALADWPDDSLYPTLIETFAQSEGDLRRKAFDAAHRFVLARPDRPEDIRQTQWKLLADKSITAAEKISVIRGLASSEASPWAEEIAQHFADTSEEDEVIDLAEKAVAHLREKIKIKDSKE
ncbi:serine/threonine protein kinase/HEAT repeat protein [Haloferula luteola]|uniref:Serine/threonine protein kinase/HEAT repeat protein n=1 Tax=Haloferula luteola TaxID=595692 RepID=A0A840UWC4_9BACT|nr:protein kinase [Haloferula luteola]MBB5350457.1 serine/threonine protein kinase/HEAT repeat protein [Haloferula luteola]